MNKYKQLLAAAVACVFLLQPTTVLGSGWGLGYPEPGKTPRGNENMDYLKQFDAYYVGDDSRKVVYLTFDSGYEEGHTEKILQTLKENDVKATFFLVGTYLKKNEQLVKKMVDEGHIVGNHTMSHPDMSTIYDRDKFINEITGVEKLYKEITGQEMLKFYRPPNGLYSESNLQRTKELGYKTFFWSLAYRDWLKDAQPSKEEAFDKLLGRIHPGAIVLLHTTETNTKILDELIKLYREQGYTFENLDSIK